MSRPGRRRPLSRPAYWLWPVARPTVAGRNSGRAGTWARRQTRGASGRREGCPSRLLWRCQRANRYSGRFSGRFSSPTAVKDCVPFQVNLDMARLAVPGMDLWFNAPFGQLEKHRPEGGRFSGNERREGSGGLHG